MVATWMIHGCFRIVETHHADSFGDKDRAVR